MKISESVRKRVQRGAEWLDKAEPDWVDKFVKAGKEHGFDISDPGSCVLGNVFHGVMPFDEVVHTRLPDGVSDGDLGFNENDGVYTPYEWQQLTEAWQLQVLKRLRKTSIPPVIDGVKKMFKKSVERVKEDWGFEGDGDREY